MSTRNEQKKKSKKGFTVIVILTALLIMAVGVLTVLTLLDVISPLKPADSVDTYFENPRVRSESVVVLLLMGCALPCVVLWLGFSLIPRRRKDGEPDETIEVEGIRKAEEEKKEEPEEKDGKKKKKLSPEAKKNAVRFSTLSALDREMASQPNVAYNERISLEEFCNRFRAFAAHERCLYYDIDDIRRFVASLGVSPIIIMQGMSGTGKTSLATVFGDFVMNKSNVIPIQPMWKERSDMIGYFNEFTERFNEMPLLCTLYEANYSRNLYVTILDEMNIARVEYYFADFLSLLELPDKKDRMLEVVSDTWAQDPKLFKGGRLQLPVNMWYIGTANNDDSTFAISDKVYDRAMIINLDKKAKPFIAQATAPVRISIDYWNQLVANAKETYALSEEQADRLRKLDAYLVEHFRVTFGNRIMKQITQYVPLYMACGGSEEDALDDIIAKKIFRKLETQNPVYVRNASEGLLSFMDDLFGPGSMTQCREYLKRLQRNV